MGAYQSLHDEITNYLRLTSIVVSKVEPNIDVNEEFTLRVIATNVSTDPYIVFRSVRIHVVAGTFARPVNGDFHGHPPKADLSPGESSFVDIKFLATGKLGWNLFYNPEHIASAWIDGNLDQDQFFHFWSPANQFAEIV
jgi:hypothetical protein